MVTAALGASLSVRDDADGGLRLLVCPSQISNGFASCVGAQVCGGLCVRVQSVGLQ